MVINAGLQQRVRAVAWHYYVVITNLAEAVGKGVPGFPFQTLEIYTFSLAFYRPPRLNQQGWQRVRVLPAAESCMQGGS